MKALLYKDLCMLWKTMAWMLLMVLVFSFTMPTFAAIYGAVLPLSALSYDERSKWDHYAAAMPFSVRQLVLEKYVLGWLLTLGSAVTTLLVNRLFHLSPLANLLPSSSPVPVPALILATLAGLLFSAVMLPPMFYFGTEKARLVMTVAIAAVFGSAGAMGSISINASAFSPSLSLWYAIAALVVAVLLLNIISITLSTKFYRKRHR